MNRKHQYIFRTVKTEMGSMRGRACEGMLRQVAPKQVEDVNTKKDSDKVVEILTTAEKKDN